MTRGCFGKSSSSTTKRLTCRSASFAQGYRIVHFPAVRVYHRPSTQGRCCNGTYWRFQIRNWIWIFYRHYPLVPRIRKVLTYIGVYLIKAVMNRQLMATVSGMIEGLRKTEIITRYPDKLTAEEVRQIGAQRQEENQI